MAGVRPRTPELGARTGAAAGRNPSHPDVGSGTDFKLTTPAALEAGHLQPEGERPQLVLPGSSTKNRREARLPRQPELARELAAWLAETGRLGRDRIFEVPVELVKILRRDLALAGIAYRDESGRTLAVHALRHTTATLMARAKVSPRVAQRLLRHSDVRLTLQHYTDAERSADDEAIAALPQVGPVSQPAAPRPEGDAVPECLKSSGLAALTLAPRDPECPRYLGSSKTNCKVIVAPACVGPVSGPHRDA